jgi:predicted metal-dependent phosphoesterase TrpH
MMKSGPMADVDGMRVAGTARESTGVRPEGGSGVTDTWSKADLHIHSNHSDGLAKIPEIMEYVQESTDLSVIAITDHNTLEGAFFAQSLSDMYDFEVVIGEEISSTGGHIIGLFLEEAIPARLSPVETVARINEQGGIAIIPHPFANRAFGPFGLQGLGKAMNDLAFHALEVFNASPYLMLANRLAAKTFTGGQGIAATGGSDAHVLRAVGLGYTMFRGHTVEDLRCSIANLETYAEAEKGQLALALRYMFRYPAIRRQQSWNWERCKTR